MPARGSIYRDAVISLLLQGPGTIGKFRDNKNCCAYQGFLAAARAMRMARIHVQQIQGTVYVVILNQVSPGNSQHERTTGSTFIPAGEGRNPATSVLRLSDSGGNR